MNKNIVAIGIGGCGTNIVNYIREQNNTADILIIDKNIEDDARAELKSKLKEYWGLEQEFLC